MSNFQSYQTADSSEHELFRDRWINSQIPTHYWGVQNGMARGPKNTAWWKAADTAVGLVGSGCRVVLIHGNSGTGKTQLSVHLAHRAAFGGSLVRFVNAIDAVLEFKSASRSDDKSEADFLNELCLPNLLIIDEITNEDDKWLRLLWRVICRRWDNELLTVLTSSSPFEKLRKNVLQMTGNRLLEKSEVINLRDRIDSAASAVAP